MKTNLVIFAVVLLLLSNSCKKDPPDQSTLLPHQTIEVTNTFSCLVDGLVLLPSDGDASFRNPYPHKGIENVFNNDESILDLKFYNNKGKIPSPFFLDIYVTDISNLKPGDYLWKQGIFGSHFTDQVNKVYGSFYDDETKNYEWFLSYDGSGKTSITRIDVTNHIISATFSGKLRKKDGLKEVTITNGQFDLNWLTVNYKDFP